MLDWSLITTRISVEDLGRWESYGAPVLRLTKLSEKAGAQLIGDRLRCAVEEGLIARLPNLADEELRQASRDFGGHPLALTLLSSYAVELYDGDIRKRDRIRGLLADAEIKEHDHAYRVLEFTTRNGSAIPQTTQRTKSVVS